MQRYRGGQRCLESAGLDVSPPLRAMNNDKSTPNGGGQVGVCITGSKTHALTAMGADASEDGTGRGTPIVTADTIVRRLTPTECERLQGFPDGYTAIPGAKDGPRYKSLGNSMTTKVMRWIGQRIDVVDKVFNKSNQ